MMIAAGVAKAGRTPEQILHHTSLAWFGGYAVTKRKPIFYI